VVEYVLERELQLDPRRERGREALPIYRTRRLRLDYKSYDSSRNSEYMFLYGNNFVYDPYQELIELAKRNRISVTPRSLKCYC
jgi:hypothetical protein